MSNYSKWWTCTSCLLLSWMVKCLFSCEIKNRPILFKIQETRAATFNNRFDPFWHEEYRCHTDFWWDAVPFFRDISFSCWCSAGFQSGNTLGLVIVLSFPSFRNFCVLWMIIMLEYSSSASHFVSRYFGISTGSHGPSINVISSTSFAFIQPRITLELHCWCEGPGRVCAKHIGTYLRQINVSGFIWPKNALLKPIFVWKSKQDLFWKSSLECAPSFRTVSDVTQTLTFTDKINRGSKVTSQILTSLQTMVCGDISGG